MVSIWVHSENELLYVTVPSFWDGCEWQKRRELLPVDKVLECISSDPLHVERERADKNTHGLMGGGKWLVCLVRNPGRLGVQKHVSLGKQNVVDLWG